MAEFIEVLSPKAIESIEQLNLKLQATVKLVNEVGAGMTKITPSASDANIKKLTAANEAYNKSLTKSQVLLDKEKISANQVEASNLRLEAQKNKSIESTNRQVLANQRLNSAYNQLNRARTEAKNKLRDLISAENASTSAVKKAQREFDILDQKVRKADKAVGDMSKNVGNYKSAFGGLSSLMGAFGIGTGVYLFAQVAKDVFQTTRELQSLDLALKNVSGSSEAFAKNQAFLSSLAEQYGVEIKSLTKNYTDFLAAAKGIISQEKIDDIFTSVSKSAAAMGLSVESTDSAFLALEQMMSKGTIQAEELKKQLGNALPGAMRAAAMAYMELHPQITSVQKAEALLMKEMKAGAIDSATYIPLIVKNFEKLYGIENVNRIDTLNGSVNRLSNAWTDLVRTVNESPTNGLGMFFTIAISGLTDIVNLIANATSGWETLRGKAKLKGTNEGKDEFKEKLKDALSGSLTDDEVNKIKKRLEEIKKEIYAAATSGKSTDSLNLEKSQLSNMLFVNKSTNAESAAKKIGDEARKQLKLTQDELTKYKTQLAEIDTGGFSSFLGADNIDFINNKIVELTKELAKQASIVKESKANFGINTKPTDNNETEEQRKKREKEEQAARDKALKSAQDEIKKLLELRILKREIQKQGNDELLYEQALYLKKRIDLTNENYDLDKKTIEDKRKTELSMLKEGTTEYKIVQEKYRLEEMKLDFDHKNNLLKQLDDFYKEQQDIREKYEGEGLKVDMEGLGITKQAFGDKQDKEKADEEAKAKAKLEATKQYIQSFIDSFASDAGLSSLFETLQMKTDDWSDNYIENTQRIMEGVQEMYNFITKLSQENFDAEYDRLKKQKEVSLKFAGQSEEAKNKIEEEYESRRRAIALRESKAKKQQAIFNIAIDTAQAVMATLGKTGFAGTPLAIIIAAIGAAQIAAVSAQKIPEYWKGTDSAVGGLAYTQERGAEIITDKHGKVKTFGSTKGAQLTMMEKGDKVYTAQESQMMFDNELNGILTNNGISNKKVNVNNGMTAGQMDMVLTKHFANIQTNHISIDRNGIHNYASKAGNITREISNRANGKGLNV